MKFIKNKKMLFATMAVFLAASCNILSQSAPAGMLKSTDGGADWQFINKISESTSSSLASANICTIAFDPTNRDTVFAGSFSGGLYKSEDGGSSWKSILSKIYVYDFAVNRSDPKIIFAAGYYSDHGRVLKTTDGGSSWNQIYNEESTANAVRAVAINPDNPNQIIIGTASGSVIKSADGGMSWQLAKDFSDRINRIKWQSGTIYVLAKTKGMYKSPDFGGSFQEITTALSKTYNLAGLAYTTATIDNFNQFYVDDASPSLMYLTTNKGLYKSMDAGASWQNQKLPVKSDESEARGIAVAATSSNIVYTSVGSTVYKSTDGGLSWQTQGIASAGFINYILADPQLPQIVYAGVYAND